MAEKGNKNAVGNSGGGRPSKYKPEFVEQAKKACEVGFTDREVALLFGVSEATLNTWKLEHPEFSGALKAAKEPADLRVQQSLYHRAVGYSYPAVKIMAVAGEVVKVPYTEHVPPDTTAMIFWLKNRQSDKWRDVHKIEHGRAGEFDDLTDEQLHARIEALAGEPGRSGQTRKRIGAPKGKATLQ